MTTPSEWIGGIHAVASRLEHDPTSVRRLLIQANRQDARVAELVALGRRHGIVLEFHPRQELDRRLPGARHQGLIAECAPVQEMDEAALWEALTQTEQGLWLVLDHLQDPHNLGACLRTAAAAQVAGVIIPRDRAVGLNATVRKVASGAAERVPVYRVVNLARCLRTLRDAGIRIVGADGAAQEDLYAVDLRGSLALVLGGEGEGLRRLTREGCDHLVRIPMAPGIESLNVSVAAGICLYEAVRQRRIA